MYPLGEERLFCGVNLPVVLQTVALGGGKGEGAKAELSGGVLVRELYL